MSKGVIFAEVEIHDLNEYEKYRPLAASAIEAAGGRYYVRRGDPEMLEGNPATKLVVIVEFPTREKAKEFYYSTRYQEAAAIRQRASTTRMILLSGYDG
jgi:uncharacterized protein (DUF1330 family)